MPLQDTLTTAAASGWSDIGDFMQAVESLATVLALAVGGAWTYLVFVRQRQRYPRATLSLNVSDVRLANGRVLLRVAGQLRNIGATLITVDQVEVLVQRVAPLRPEVLDALLAAHQPDESGAACEIGWYRVGHRCKRYDPGEFEIEPGESDTCHYDFVLNRRTATVKIKLHVANREKRTRSGRLSLRVRPQTIGWTTSMYYDLASAAVGAGGRASDQNGTHPRATPSVEEPHHG